MATIIHFVGGDQVMVREDEAEVQAVFVEAGGRPAALTHHRSGNPVFVNPAQVTFWQGRGARAKRPRAATVQLGPSAGFQLGQR
ncbi:MAG: hypothetical protein ACM3NV_06850 [Syntrophothermus sp.]